MYNFSDSATIMVNASTVKLWTVISIPSDILSTEIKLYTNRGQLYKL